jgi:hypothetical protein
MSTNRRITTAGWISPQELPTGPAGRALCRWCSNRRADCLSDPEGYNQAQTAQALHALRTEAGPLSDWAEPEKNDFVIAKEVTLCGNLEWILPAGSISLPAPASVWARA